MNQSLNFHHNRIDKMVINGTANSPAPTRTIKQTTNLDPEHETWVGHIASAVSMATGNHKYGKASVVFDAVKFFRLFYSHSAKMIRNHEKVISFVDQFLP